MKSLNEIKPAASRIFKTRDGEVLLEHLKEKFYDRKIDNDEMARQVGQRDVIRYIYQLLREQ